MGIEMPAEVRWLIPIVVGDSWPEGDETALQRLAEVWKQAATDVDDAMRAADDAVKQASSNMDGEAAEAFKKYWEKFVKGEEATLPKMKDVSEKLSTACRNCAMQIEYAKLSIIIALVILAIQIAVMIASAVVSFGASTAGIVPAQLATRAGVQIVFRQLVQQLMQQVGRNLIGKLALQVGIEVATSVATDLAVQGIQLAKGTRDTLDTNLTLDAAKSGLISGVVGMGVGAGMGKVLGDGVGDSIGRSIGRNAAEEAVIGAGSALAEGALSEEGIKAENVLFGATSGAVSGTVSGTKSGIEGLNADIGVPTAGDMPRPDTAPRVDGPPGPPPATPSPSSTPDAEAPPRRSADATNTSYAAPPTEQPQHRATPDATPAASAPSPSPSSSSSPSQQPQGFSQSPGQSAPPAAPAASNAPGAPAAPRSSMPSAPSMGGPSPSSGGGFTPSSSPSPSGGHVPGSGGPAQHNAPAAGSGSHTQSPAPSGPPSTGPSHADRSGPAPVSAPTPNTGGPAPSHVAGTGGHPPMSPSGPPAAGQHAGPPSGPGQHGSPPAPGGHTPAGPGHHPHLSPAPAQSAPGGHSPGGPPPHVSPVSGPMPPTGPGVPHPNQGPPQRPHHADDVQQAATSMPAASAPFAAPPNRGPHDTPSAQQPAAPAHLPPQQGHAVPPQQPRHTSAPPRQATPPQQTPRHAPPTHHSSPPQPAHSPANPRHQQTPVQHQFGAQHDNGAPHTRPGADAAAPTPHNAPPPENSHQAELDRIRRNNTPVEMPDGLRHLEPWAKRTDAGLSLHVGQSSPYHDTARNVAPDPNRFTVDIHGNSSKVSVGDTTLTPKQLADVIRGAGWDGEQPIRLISCQTGRDSHGFAAQLAKELGADVVAPTKDVWVDLQGNVFASSSHLDPNNAALHRPGWPPNGDWVSYRPDGTTHNHNRPMPPDHTPTWGDVTPEAAAKAWRRNWPSPGEQPQQGNWQNRGQQPPYDPRLDRSRQLPPPRPGFAPPPGMGRQPMPPQGPPRGGHRPPMPQQFGNRPPPPQQFGNRPPTPQQFGNRPPPPQQFGNRPPMPPQGPPPGGHRPPMPPPAMRPNQPLRPNGPMPPPGNFGPPGHRPPPPAGMPPRRHDEPARPAPPAPSHLPAEPVPVVREQPAPEPTPAPQPQEPPFRTRPKTDADYNREAAMRFAKSPEPEAAPEPNTVTRARWTGDLTVEFINDALQEQFRRDRTGGGKVLYESELAHDFEPGNLPPGLTTDIPRGAYDHMATRVDLDGVFLDEVGGQPVHRDRSEGLAFLDEPLFRMDDREYAPLLQEGHQPRNTANLGMGAHIGDTIRGQGSAFVSFSRSPEATIQRNQTTAGDGIVITHDPKQVALDGIAITRIQYMHEGYHPYGIDSDASYVNSGRKDEGGHRESEYLFAGGFPADHIYRVWPRVAHFDVHGNVIKIEVLQPIVNDNFRWINEMRDRQ